MKKLGGTGVVVGVLPDYSNLPPIGGGEHGPDDPPAPPAPPAAPPAVTFTQTQVDSMIAAAKREAKDAAKVRIDEAERRGHEAGRAEALKESGVDGKELHGAVTARDKALRDLETEKTRADNAEALLAKWEALADVEYDAGVKKLPPKIARLVPKGLGKLERREWLLEALQDEDPAPTGPPAPGPNPPAPVPPAAPPPGPPTPNVVTVEMEMQAMRNDPTYARRMNRTG